MFLLACICLNMWDNFRTKEKDSRLAAKKKLQEMTEAPNDVSAVADESSKRERKQTSKMLQFTVDMVEVTSTNQAKEKVKLNDENASKPRRSGAEKVQKKSQTETVSKKTTHAKVKRKSTGDIAKTNKEDHESTEKREKKEQKKQQKEAIEESKSLSNVADILMESLISETDDQPSPIKQTKSDSSLLADAVAISMDVSTQEEEEEQPEPLPDLDLSNEKTPTDKQYENQIIHPIARYPTCEQCPQLKMTVQALQQKVFEMGNNIYQLHERLCRVETNQYQSCQWSQSPFQSPVQSRPTSSSTSTVSSDSQEYHTDNCQIDSMQNSNTQDTLYNGFTKSQLLHDMPGRGWKGDAKWLLRRMFTMEELKGHSITGGHGSKKNTDSKRPPLEDQQKLKVLYDMVIEKYPGRLVSDINIVPADVVKPSAPGMS